MAKESIKLVVFTLENNKIIYEYGIPIEQVHEITRQGKTLAMPGMPDFVEGIMNLRSNVIPIIDLKKRFGLGTTVEKDTTRIMVINIDNKKCGIVVDDVLEIIPIASEEMEDAPTVTGGISSNYILGIGKVENRLIIALDMNKILTGKEEKELKNVV
ncbi:purine-binding chemotaxis protein CheW [Sporomusaceae bacterium BoRhaA]|uniref:chemotaxis protein CheW n=1 Tax=Pelorhabdus rhamnosifermentans TaxID=2772457 RepID=UPI001C0618DE|nr:chemotaxis protein CheW [Pelorhabdus rhamnosifermentans]MBU2702111.1 purine-binding chemotaxis protein CheW [Pelorhabdus rhamnosifermentans]